MAEERIEILVTPERTMLEDSNMRNSTGKTNTSSSREKILLPHYLRASTGSCHDFCKYGRKHAFEAKGKHHIPRSFTATIAKCEDSVNSATVSERKKKPAIKLRPSLDLKTQSANSSEIIKQEDPLSGKKKEASPKDAFAYPKQALSPANQVEVSPRRASAPGKIIGVSQKQALFPAKKMEVHGKQGLSPAKKIEVSPKQALPPAKKIEVSPKQALPPANKSEASSKLNASAKSGSSLKPNSIAAKPSAPSGLSGSLEGKRNSDCMIVKKMRTSKIGEKKVFRTPIVSVSPIPSVNGDLSLNTRKSRNAKAVFPLKSQNNIKKTEPKLSIPVKEKTVIEPPECKSLEPARNGSHTTQSSPSLSSSSLASSFNSSSSQSSPLPSSHVEEENEELESILSEVYDSNSEYDDTENVNQLETLNVEDKESGRGSFHPENTDCLQQKLKFRRGQEVNLQSENNGLRRLRFRQGKVLGENDGKGHIGTKSLRMSEVTDGDTDSTKPESEMVVLRHQDVQGKKEAQGLFNNVIEETASKLVETRMSKVKALVGAFETVISLQESKPSSG